MIHHNEIPPDQQADFARQIDAWKLRHDYRKEEYVRRCNLVYGVTIQMYVVYSGIGYLASRIQPSDPRLLGWLVISAAFIALGGAWLFTRKQLDLARRDKKIRETCENQVFKLSGIDVDPEDDGEGRHLEKAEYQRILWIPAALGGLLTLGITFYVLFALDMIRWLVHRG